MEMKATISPKDSETAANSTHGIGVMGTEVFALYGLRTLGEAEGHDRQMAMIEAEELVAEMAESADIRLVRLPGLTRIPYILLSHPNHRFNSYLSHHLAPIKRAVHQGSVRVETSTLGPVLLVRVFINF